MGVRFDRPLPHTITPGEVSMTDPMAAKTLSALRTERPLNATAVSDRQDRALHSRRQRASQYRDRLARGVVRGKEATHEVSMGDESGASSDISYGMTKTMPIATCKAPLRSLQETAATALHRKQYEL